MDNDTKSNSSSIVTSVRDKIEKKEEKEMWDEIIEPPRQIVYQNMLEPAVRSLDQLTTYSRYDGKVKSLGNLLIQYNFFSLEQEMKSPSREPTCLVYLHSHGSNRLEGMQMLRIAGRLRFHFAIFDFQGSGESEGRYTTMGQNEAKQVEDVLEMITQEYGVYRFLLWGRSMGAVAALTAAHNIQTNKRLSETIKLDFLVLDSPFPSFEQIVRDMGARYLKVGEYIALMMFNFAKEDIERKTGVDFGKIRPIDLCWQMETPCMFLSSNDDELIPSERVEEMFLLYNSLQKELVKIQGTHTSSRSSLELEKICDKIVAFYKLNFRNTFSFNQTLLKKNEHGSPDKLAGKTSNRGEGRYLVLSNTATQQSQMNMGNRNVLVNKFLAHSQTANIQTGQKLRTQFTMTNNNRNAPTTIQGSTALRYVNNSQTSSPLFNVPTGPSTPKKSNPIQFNNQRLQTLNNNLSNIRNLTQSTNIFKSPEPLAFRRYEDRNQQQLNEPIQRRLNTATQIAHQYQPQLNQQTLSQQAPLGYHHRVGSMTKDGNAIKNTLVHQHQPTNKNGAHQLDNQNRQNSIIRRAQSKNVLIFDEEYQTTRQDLSKSASKVNFQC